MIYKFYKETNGEWFIDLPSYPGFKEDLQMVCGADLMLDILAEGQVNIRLDISDKKDDLADIILELVREEDFSGATYVLPAIGGIKYDFEVWLCDVTKFVFGEFPKNIYINRVLN